MASTCWATELRLCSRRLRLGKHIGRFEYQEVPGDDSRQRAYSGYLARYYDEIVAYLRDAGAVLIFGPGEAKGELKKRFEKEKTGAHIVTMEKTDKMTESQIVAHVHHHFDLEAHACPN
jgi:hypothetical protein